MNLLLLEPGEIDAEGVAVINDRRYLQLRDVHQVKLGDPVRAGVLGGMQGQAKVLQIDAHQVHLQTEFTHQPPTPLPVILVLALPRPKMLRRCLRMVAELGIKELYLINSYRVEKSYWLSPLLQPEQIRESLISGLEQVRDTLLPTVHLRKRFKPFVEDELPGLIDGRKGLLAHPVDDAVALQDLHTPMSDPSLLSIGPEGGFIPYEVAKMQQAGLQTVTLGDRILRVETVLPFLFGRLYF